ncbi:sensor histidine kinase [Sphaerisporangium aureirubrum]
MRSWWRAHPLIGDSALAVPLAGISIAVALITGPGGLTGTESHRAADAASLTLITLNCLLLVGRRRWPFVLLCVSQVPHTALVAMDHDGGITGLVSLVLLYTVAAYRGLALSLAAAGVSALGYAAAVAVSERPDWTQHAFALVLAVAVWVVGRSVRLRRAYLAELVDRAERLERARDADTRAARAEERSRIARELHDVVAHHVSVMTVQAAAARKVLDTRPEAAKDALVAIEEMGRTAMREMRGIVGVLRTDGETGELTPQPGMEDLPGLVDQMREAGLRAQLWVEGDQRSLPPGIDLAAYRLVQEALTNSLRHAGPAARAWVTVRHEQSGLTVHVEDDGRGGPGAFTRGPDDRPGHGLVGIRERVALYGGILRIGPRQGGGFEVRARFPLKD